MYLYFFTSGCYTRAELFSKRIVELLKKMFPEKTFDPPRKHFVFGTLWVRSNNTLTGTLSWKYHVAPIVRLYNKKLYILDPALSADAIEKEKWYGLMEAAPEANITGYVTCASASYWPFDYCLPDPATHFDQNELESQIQGFLAALVVYTCVALHNSIFWPWYTT